MSNEEFDSWRRVRAAIRRDQPVATADVVAARAHLARNTAMWRAALPAAAAIMVVANIILRIAHGTSSTQFILVEVVLVVLCGLSVVPWLRVRRWAKRHPLP